MRALHQSKHGVGPLIVVLLAIIIVFVVIWLSGIVKRECSKDSECQQDNYCGADFQCHEQKMVTRTIVYNYNLFGASVVIGLAIILTAIILKSRRIKHI